MSETETTDETAQSQPQGSKLPSKIIDVLAEWTLYVSAALIIMGISQPSIMKPNTIGLQIEYNLWGVVRTLFEFDLVFMGVVVILFSGVFPLSKSLLAAIIFRRGAPPSPGLAHWLNLLGKWSMLDVFLAALLIGLSQTMAYVGFFPRIGLYYFTAGVVLNNLATLRLSFSRWKPDPR
ncbi:paraquat-inducible protein A [Henriciella aquimarina]|uniref:paraquat-inducible protein A n=1 Tax=Henriciella aquimarina TaxID=545261 RepID=UPI000A054AA8|nr:paraquat-inducible protein A [Henriciella aquimarina]